MPILQKSQDTPKYDSEEAGSHSDSDEEVDQHDPEQERVSRIHDQCLSRLANRPTLPKIPPLSSEDQYATGTDNMTILHYLLSHQPYCKLRYNDVFPLLDQLLDSDDQTVRAFLSSKDANGATALTLAVSERRWDILLHLLRHKGALTAAAVPSGQDNNNCLHEIVLKRSSRNFRQIGAGDRDRDLPACIELILSSNSKELITGRNKYGFTPLHLATKFNLATKAKNKPIPDGQLELVSQLINAYPELLTIVNNEGKSPYQYRLHTLKTSSNDDPILFLMKDHYMHLDDRNEAAKYLYGKEDAELSMEIDLSEHPIYKFSCASLENPSRHWKFENILRYVHFPEVRLEELPDNNPTKDIEKKQGQRKSYGYNDTGIGREDLKVIFDWLQNHCKVKKIIKVRVEDNVNPPHSDQIIEESLKDLGVEVLNWFKFDLCSETILKAAPGVKEVHLYSSGNNAVLRSWSGSDGLKKLSQLKIVHIVIYQRLETYERTKKMLKEFKDRLEERVSGIKIKERIERYSAHRGNGLADQNSSTEGGSQQQTHTWIKHMDTFVNFAINSSIAVHKVRKIKVALIDNGVDSSHPQLEQIISLGTSYCCRPHNQSQINSYWAPSRAHGTQMACLIRRVCPEVDLYVARIQDMEAEDSRQIDVESVVKAINWAVDHKVDIISMSWTIERTEDNKTILGEGLRRAISRASSASILMFCSTDDQGKLSKDDIYPGRFPGTFKIGGAKASGNEAEWTDKNSDYTFPGEALTLDIRCQLISNTNNLVSGSSLATALASGMAALLLYCVQICDNSGNPEKALERARDYDNMDRAFRRMTNKNKEPRYIRAWEYLQPEFKNLPEEEGIDELKKAITDLFK